MSRKIPRSVPCTASPVLPSARSRGSRRWRAFRYRGRQRRGEVRGSGARPTVRGAAALDLRARSPAFRAGLARRLAQGRGRRCHHPRPGRPGARRGRGPPCRPGCDLRADAHRHQARRAGRQAGHRPQPGRPPLLLRPLRSGQRGLPALARGRHRARRRVRGGARLSGPPAGGDRRRHAAAAPARAAHLAGPAGLPDAGPLRPAAARPLRVPRSRHRRPQGGRLHGGDPRLPEAVPTLPDRARLQRPLPRRAAGRRGRGRPSAGRRRGGAPLLRRPGCTRSSRSSATT